MYTFRIQELESVQYLLNFFNQDQNLGFDFFIDKLFEK